MQQLPNILKEQTWDTPGINDTLIGQTHSFIDDQGMWCFKVTMPGLWRIWPEVNEKDGQNVYWDKHDIKAYVTDTGMHPLYFT